MKNLSAANRWNADLIDQQYHIWLNTPEKLSEDWRHFFEGFELGSTGQASSGSVGHADSLVLREAIQAYRTLGHTIAQIDPLKFSIRQNSCLSDKALGLTDSILKQPFAGKFQNDSTCLLGSEVIHQLKKIYCGSIGFEYMHIQNPAHREWLQQAIEKNTTVWDASVKRRMLDKISQAEEFERFLHTRFVGQKRFSIEGGEAMMAGLDLLAELSADAGVESLILGMAHRGRLNVLTHFVGKSHIHLFRDFTEGYLPDNTYGDGDVKYHLGYHKEHTTSRGKKIDLLLAYNPSHLEAVNAIVEGRTRAQQDIKHNQSQVVLPVLIHGDAAVIGQGIVAEILNLARLKGYTTGGTLHLVINNQIGFTTNPEDSRSSAYCTDVAKMIDAPVFHVNGDDPLALASALSIGLQYRQLFGEDVFIDLICYRKYGHNETDEPMFTQPTLYKAVNQHPALSQTFGRVLEQDGTIQPGELEKMRQAHVEYYEKALEQAKLEAKKPAKANPTQPAYDFNPVDTTVKAPLLQSLGESLTQVPAGFKLNSKIERQLQAKAEMLKAQKGIDWSLGEALAYASLLVEGHTVRLSGQDCERGTFSHRHAVLYDVENRNRYEPFNHLPHQQAPFFVYNSALSEESVLGFEYGYSLERADALTIWEAQFGDFANGAQVMIDQFIVSAESKWTDTSALTLLLPHGYEGQGPEHSSARLERFLQACAEDNIQVCNLTTPAQLFHALRRQLKQACKKPLIIMSPKSLLRHKDCISNLNDFTQGTFQPILDDLKPAQKTKNLILCSGKIYYDLLAARDEKGIKDTTILRIEQLYPLHTQQLETLVKRYAGFKTLVWCQEEPKNMGAYAFIAPHLEALFGVKPIYAGRKASASPAVGSLARHKLEQAALIEQAFKP